FLLLRGAAGRARARRAAHARRAAALAHAFPAGGDRRARRGAAPLLQPVPSDRAAARYARADLRHRQGLQARAAAGRVPAREAAGGPRVLPHHAAAARYLSPDPPVRRLHAQIDAGRIPRGPALRAQEGRRHAARGPDTIDRIFPSRQRRRSLMKPQPRRIFTALAAFALLAACASDGMIKDTRQMMSEGRSEEALATLAKEIQENPHNNPVKQEFYRQRDYATSQWLVRAEAFRSAGPVDAADQLYPRPPKYDPAHLRATP